MRVYGVAVAPSSLLTEFWLHCYPTYAPHGCDRPLTYIHHYKGDNDRLSTAPKFVEVYMSRLLSKTFHSTSLYPAHSQISTQVTLVTITPKHIPCQSPHAHIPLNHPYPHNYTPNSHSAAGKTGSSPDKSDPPYPQPFQSRSSLDCRHPLVHR